jgi:hypothetical protein
MVFAGISNRRNFTALNRERRNFLEKGLFCRYHHTTGAADF